MIHAKQIGELSVANLLGEGIQWRHSDQTLWWTDILSSKLYHYDPHTGSLDILDMPEPLGSFAFTSQKDTILAAFATGFATFNLTTGALTWLHRPTFLDGEGRFNDGRIDRNGRFWSGTMMENPTDNVPLTGRLFCLDTKQTISVQETNVTISNGLCWSPSGDRMYFADSPTGSIYAYDFNVDTGLASGKRVFARSPKGGVPDGAAVDADGNVWSAQWGLGKILVYAPNGNVIGSVDVPVSQPTCVAFGGEDLNWLYVSSACDGLGADERLTQPGAGNVFIFETNAQGLPENTYAGVLPALKQDQ